MDKLPRTRFEILIEKPNLKSLGRANYPFIWVRDKNNIETLNHERLHHKQSLELWIVGSWFLYSIFNHLFICTYSFFTFLFFNYYI